GEEGVCLVFGQILGQVAPGSTKEHGEEGQPDQDRVEDVVGPDRHPLVLGLEHLLLVAHLHDRHSGDSPWTRPEVTVPLSRQNAVIRRVSSPLSTPRSRLRGDPGVGEGKGGGYGWGGGCRVGTHVIAHVLTSYRGSEMPCARISRKW